MYLSGLTARVLYTVCTSAAHCVLACCIPRVCSLHMDSEEGINPLELQLQKDAYHYVNARS